MIQLRHMDQVVTTDEGELIIDLCDHDTSCIGSWLGIVARKTEGAVALFIGSGQLNDSNIYRVKAIGKEPWHLMEVAGEEVYQPRTARLACIGLEEVDLKIKVLGYLRRKLVPSTIIQDVKDITCG